MTAPHRTIWPRIRRIVGVGGLAPVEIRRQGLNLPGGPTADADDDGYTDLEEWLHELASALEQGSG